KIEKEKDIPMQTLIELIESAIASAYKKTFSEAAEIRLRPDASKKGLRLCCEKQVVETVENPHREMSIAEARHRNPATAVGDLVDVDLIADGFGRIAAQPDKQVVVQVIVSSTHPSLSRRLFELKVPEIADGVVTIKSVAREPGARSKIAVATSDEKVDPVGACVGHRGSRVQAIVNELYGEKIDIVRWNPHVAEYITAALSPAKVMSVTVNEAAKSAFVIVPDHQLSLAIGKEGQNVRLAARLTQWRIDIRSETQAK